MGRRIYKLPEKDGWNSPGPQLYDPGFVAYLGLIFDPTRACADVGANVGKVTRFLAERTARRVYAFEPSPANYAALEENTSNLPNVVLHAVALADYRGSGEFVGGGTVTGHLTASGRGVREQVRVERLDEVLDGDVGLVKIDVEGGELAVLRGATRLLEECRPLLAVEVIDGHLRRGGSSRAEVFDFLSGYGYGRAVNKFGMVERHDRPTGAADVFFLPRGWYAPNLACGYRKIFGRGEGTCSF